MGRAQKIAGLAAAIDTGGGFTFRNRLINADFRTNQRGYVSGTNTSGANEYTLDRWRVVTSGQAVTFSSTGNVVTVTAPAGGMEQVIEGANLVTATYVLNWEGTATATVGGNAVTKGGTVSVTGGSNLTIRFTGGTVSKPQFEAGAAPTVFEERPIGLELMLCQRYYEKGVLAANHWPLNGGDYYQALIIPIPFKATKRNASYQMAYAGVEIYVVGTPTAYGGSISTVTLGLDQCSVHLSSSVTNNSGLAAGSWTCNNEL